MYSSGYHPIFYVLGPRDPILGALPREEVKRGTKKAERKTLMQRERREWRYPGLLSKSWGLLGSLPVT